MEYFLLKQERGRGRVRGRVRGRGRGHQHLCLCHALKEDETCQVVKFTLKNSTLDPLAISICESYDINNRRIGIIFSMRGPNATYDILPEHLDR